MHTCIQRVFRPIILAVLIQLALAGCSTDYYKEDADQEVYQIIDEKWENEFGAKANYKISDVEPSPDDIAANQLILPSGKLSLSQAIALATAQNRSYQNQKEQLYLAALDLTQRRHDFAPQLFGSLGGDYTKNSSDESLNADGNFGFNQLLADGAQISTAIALDWLRYLTGDPRTSLGSVLTTTISQPLLRGRGRAIVQENLTQAERNTLYQIRSFNRFRKTFVVTVVNEYFGVLQQMDRVKNDQNSFESRLANQLRTEMMAETGRIERFQADQAKQSTLQSQDLYNRSQESYNTQLDQFKVRLALPVDVQIELDPNELDGLEAIGIMKPDFLLEEAVQTALTYRLDLANERDQLEDAARKVEVAADNLGADLDLVGSMHVDSGSGTDFTNLLFNDGTYRLGLELDLPLDRKNERNAYRRALISLLQNERNYQEKIDDVKLEVRQAYRDLRETYSSYTIQLESLNLAYRRVESTKLLLQEGRATTRDYLDAQDDLLTAQNAKTGALIRHFVARLSFFRDVGILQIKPDGLWEQPDDVAFLLESITPDKERM
ncbi:MAG: TolC family protein [Sedimentisphaerales bacterium]|nr:TolC family protein [Sedimentisphaerales bacterium]